MLTIDKDVREFIAKIIVDLGKAVLTVGFATYFFEKLTIELRVCFVILGISLIILSVVIYSWKGDET